MCCLLSPYFRTRGALILLGVIDSGCEVKAWQWSVRTGHFTNLPTYSTTKPPIRFLLSVSSYSGGIISVYRSNCVSRVSPRQSYSGGITNKYKQGDAACGTLMFCTVKFKRLIWHDVVKINKSSIACFAKIGTAFTLGLPPTQSYFLKKLLDVARSVARGYLKLNHVCCSTVDEIISVYRSNETFS